MTAEELIKEAEKGVKEPAPPAGEETKEEPSPDSAKGSETEEAPESRPEPEGKGEGEAPEPGPIPYERFAEVNTKKAELEEKLKSLEPAVRAYQGLLEYLKQNDIDQESFNEALELVATAKREPARARAKLLELAEKLAEYDPEHLPKDLRQRVEEGELSESAAREIARLRAERNRIARVDPAQTQAQAIAAAVTAWERAKRQADPSFKPSDNGKPGIHELTQRSFAYHLQVNPPRSPQDVIELLEKAYEEAKALFRAQSVQQPQPTLSTSKSSPKPKTNGPKTALDIAREVLARHGVNWTPE